MRTLLLVSALIALATCPVFAVTVAMDTQINLGYTYNTQSPTGDAIYAAFNSDTQTIADGYTRHNLVAGSGGGGWYYQYVDLNLAGVTTPGAGLDLSVAGSTFEFDCRYYQDSETNPNAYSDAPIFVRIYTYDADGNTYLGYRDYSMVYQTGSMGSAPYPDWTHVTIDVSGTPYTEGGTFDASNVSRVRWYGTDWTGTGYDFVDFKNLTLTPAVPEPSSILALVAGLAGILPVVRRRK